MDFVEKIVLIFFIILMFPFSAGLSFVFIGNNNLDKNNLSANLSESVFTKIHSKEIILAEETMPEKNKLKNPPEIIKAIYLTGGSAISKKYYDDYLKNLLEKTKVNAFVIDLKDYSGRLFFEPKIEEIKKYKSGRKLTYDMDEVIKKFHEKGVYLIARISIFQDFYFAKTMPNTAVYDKEKTQDLQKPELWQDNNKLYWIDPASTEFQDYNILLAKDALDRGFDEVNFDYIRFPSDGKIENMEFPIWDKKIQKHLVLKIFFERIRFALPKEKLSIDLFGQTTTDYDDLGIGQIIEDAFDYFDYISPMVYPSHYAKGFMGFENPAENPYEIVKYSLDSAIARQKIYEEWKDKMQTNQTKTTQVKTIKTDASLENETAEIIVEKFESKIRPWLQDFSLGAIYTDQMVLEQINATQDSLKEKYNGFMLWNPLNVYKQGAILK